MKEPIHPDVLSPCTETSLGNDYLRLGFKQGFREFRLPYDAPQRSTPERIVKRNRDGYCRIIQTLLHDSVAALLPDCGESMLFENPADFRARQYPQSTQPVPQPE
jgi:hypothetical protein